ncbi:MAG: flagellar hook-length control protein FliK [Pseudomonadota bacterium]
MTENIPVVRLTAAQSPATAQSLSPQSDDDSATPSFSLAFAAAALETQAARALDVHGPAALRGAAAPNARSRESAQGDAARAAPTAQPASSHEASGALPRAEGSSARTEAAAQTSPHASAQTTAPTTQPTQPAAPFIGLIAASPSGAQPAPGASQNTTNVQAAARADAARPSGQAGRTALQTPTAPAARDNFAAATQNTFAKIAARNAEGASQFDIRLDPPELGRVEGRLTVQESGKAVLVLTFDNQAALDLFQRDEAALRAALENAGADTNGAAVDLEFRFEDQTPAESPPLFDGDGLIAETLIDDPVADRAPIPFSRGVVDIRI